MDQDSFAVSPDAILKMLRAVFEISESSDVQCGPGTPSEAKAAGLLSVTLAEVMHSAGIDVETVLVTLKAALDRAPALPLLQLPYRKDDGSMSSLADNVRLMCQANELVRKQASASSSKKHR